MPLYHPKSRKENKINIKSEKLDKRKEKLLVSKAFHNTGNNLFDFFPMFIVSTFIENLSLMSSQSVLLFMSIFNESYPLLNKEKTKSKAI